MDEIFEGQEHGEKVILFLRPHAITLIPSLVLIIFLMFLPFLLGVFGALVGFDLSFLTPSQSFFAIIFWYLVVLAYAFYRFIFWYFNVYLLTNERIVDFDFKGLLHKEISYARLQQIEDVSPKMRGFFSTFFHFGNVFVQTAAERPEFEFHHVANPDFVAQKIHEQVRHEESEKPGEIA
ncbi:MAG: PH domain-containing protein [Candidatus Curtissbacteria bacterium]